MIPIIISRTRQVNCIVQNDITYCEKHVPTSSDLQGASIMLILLFLWGSGLFLILKKVYIDDEISPMWVLVYILALPVFILVVSLL